MINRFLKDKFYYFCSSDISIMKRLLILLFFATAGTYSSAQKTITTSNPDSTIRITRDSRLDELIERQKQVNLEKQSMPGYRVQIYFGGNRPKASEVKLDFNSRCYPLSSAAKFKSACRRLQKSLRSTEITEATGRKIFHDLRGFG